MNGYSRKKMMKGSCGSVVLVSYRQTDALMYIVTYFTVTYNIMLNVTFFVCAHNRNNEITKVCRNATSFFSAL